MSLTMVITSIQASLNGSPESQVIKLLSPIDFAGVQMKTHKQTNKPRNKNPKPTNQNKITYHTTKKASNHTAFQ